MAEAYHFVTDWALNTPGIPLGDIWDLLAADKYSAWWPGVSTRVLEPGDASGIGARLECVFRTKLPYTISYVSRTVRLERPALIEIAASGNLTGTGLWQLSREGDVTHIRFTWDVSTNQRWMNALAPVLRPAFLWNHDRVMHSGAVGLADHLGAKLLQG